MVDVHNGAIASVVEKRGGEPLEGLASITQALALNDVNGMGDRDDVHGKYKVVDNVKDLVGDLVPEVRRECHNEQGGQDTVSGAHDLGREFVAESLLAVVAKHAKEPKKEDCRNKHDRDHGIAQVDVHLKSAVQRNKAINDRSRESGNGETRHGERYESHLKENGMHPARAERKYTSMRREAHVDEKGLETWVDEDDVQKIVQKILTIQTRVAV